MDNVSTPASAGLTFDTPAEDDAEEILGVLARGMRDNPLHIAAFGNDPALRKQLLGQLLGLRVHSSGFLDRTVVARTPDGTIVGVYSALAPGTCTPSVSDQIKMVPGLLRLGLGNAKRAATWFGTWGKNDLETPHWHFGPFAVEAALQGQGIGSAMMRHYCDEMDAATGLVYLETDKPENVLFYQKFGFEVIGEMKVPSTTNWRMVREPKAQ